MGTGYRKSLNIGEHYSYSENLQQAFFLFRGAKENISTLSNNPIINFFCCFIPRHFAPKLLVFVVGEGMGLIAIIFLLTKNDPLCVWSSFTRPQLFPLSCKNASASVSGRIAYNL